MSNVEFDCDKAKRNEYVAKKIPKWFLHSLKAEAYIGLSNYELQIVFFHDIPLEYQRAYGYTDTIITFSAFPKQKTLWDIDDIIYLLKQCNKQNGLSGYIYYKPFYPKFVKMIYIDE